MTSNLRFLALVLAGYAAAAFVLINAKHGVCTGLQAAIVGFWAGVRVFLGCW